MAGFVNLNSTSLANGIPARHIGPETGSSGNATMTNKGGPSQGTSEAADSQPPGASGLEAPIDTGAHHHVEGHASTPHPDPNRTDATTPPAGSLDETAAQLIADGGDRIKHDHHHKDRTDR